MTVPFIVGVRHLDRQRGTGWLDCPNCGEHTANDVVDDMSFAAVTFFRLTPVGRRRFLICRQCAFRRRATTAELLALDTAGKSLHRAWFVPFGVIGIAAVLWAVVTIGGGANDVLAQKQISFRKVAANALGPFTFDQPTSWTADPATDSESPYAVTDPGSGQRYVLRRITDAEGLQDILDKHFADEAGLSATCFPTHPPKPTKTKVGGQDALQIVMRYTSRGSQTQITMVAFKHDGAAYTISYSALRADVFDVSSAIAKHVDDSVRFTGGEPSPSAGTSPVASASPAPSESASPGQSPSSGAPSPTSSETPQPGCA